MNITGLYFVIVISNSQIVDVFNHYKSTHSILQVVWKFRSTIIKFFLAHGPYREISSFAMGTKMFFCREMYFSLDKGRQSVGFRTFLWRIRQGRNAHVGHEYAKTPYILVNYLSCIIVTSVKNWRQEKGINEIILYLENLLQNFWFTFKIQKL